ncbi:MAG: glycosyltransferase [Fusobacterium sp.]|uniref:glycosyltransferase n=1 Tax=Fusobacterium sp. TaxID=68766 RepID=UPI002E79BF19|nr:glycosyltransferase [Fusobacterium sp.]MEE1475929.1 glycosyltransferase [Fusobacterium sp.]
MKDRIKVSVVVPVYNVEKYLDRCIQSILNQTLKEIEIILIDDGSPDSCPKICDQYAKKYNKIKVVHKENQGLGFARNSGIEIATGEYIAFVDSDDFIEKNMFEYMYKISIENEVDMCMAGYYIYNTRNNIKKEIKITTENIILTENEAKLCACRMIGNLPEELRDEYYGMSVWKNLYSLEFLRKNNIKFNSEREYVSEDAIFHLNCVPKMKRIIIIPKSFYNYCDNSDSITLTKTFRESKFEEYKKLYFKEIEILTEYNEIEEDKFYIARMFLGNTRAYIKQLEKSKVSIIYKFQQINKICNDSFLQGILSWYPYKKNPRAQRIYSELLKRKNVFLLWLLVKLQNNFKS